MKELKPYLVDKAATALLKKLLKDNVEPFTELGNKYFRLKT